MLGSVSLLDLVNFVFIIAMSTAVHEGAHAWTANRFGDDTPRRAGRMTLNPLAHIDPMGSVVVPAVLYAMGGIFVAWGSTPVTPMNMRNPRLHGALCSVAGPAANFGLAALTLAAACGTVIALGGIPAIGSGERQVLDVLFMAVWMNLWLGLFNLVPLPPLDGSHVLMAALPLDLALRYASLKRYAFYVLVILALTGILGDVLEPLLRALVDIASFALDLAHRFARG